jgi:hypothetical protein
MAFMEQGRERFAAERLKEQQRFPYTIRDLFMKETTQSVSFRSVSF